MDKFKKLNKATYDNIADISTAIKSIFDLESRSNSAAVLLGKAVEKHNTKEVFNNYRTFITLNKSIELLKPLYKPSTLNKIRSDINIILKNNKELYESNIYQRHVCKIFNPEDSKQLSSEYSSRVREKQKNGKKVEININAILFYIRENIYKEIKTKKDLYSKRIALTLALGCRYVESIGEPHSKWEVVDKHRVKMIWNKKQKKSKNWKPVTRYVLHDSKELMKVMEDIRKHVNMKNTNHQNDNNYMKRYITFIPKEYRSVKVLRPLGMLSAYALDGGNENILTYIQSNYGHVNLQTSESYIKTFKIVLKKSNPPIEGEEKIEKINQIHKLIENGVITYRALQDKGYTIRLIKEAKELLEINN
jgi:hypothetical protein